MFILSAGKKKNNITVLNPQGGKMTLRAYVKKYDSHKRFITAPPQYRPIITVNSTVRNNKKIDLRQAVFDELFTSWDKEESENKENHSTSAEQVIQAIVRDSKKVTEREIRRVLTQGVCDGDFVEKPLRDHARQFALSNRSLEWCGRRSSGARVKSLRHIIVNNYIHKYFPNKRSKNLKKEKVIDPVSRKFISVKKYLDLERYDTELKSAPPKYAPTIFIEEYPRPTEIDCRLLIFDVLKNDELYRRESTKEGVVDLIKQDYRDAITENEIEQTLEQGVCNGDFEKDTRDGEEKYTLSEKSKGWYSVSIYNKKFRYEAQHLYVMNELEEESMMGGLNYAEGKVVDFGIARSTRKMTHLRIQLIDEFKNTKFPFFLRNGFTPLQRKNPRDYFEEGTVVMFSYQGVSEYDGKPEKAQFVMVRNMKDKKI
jgi:hypothetical protein